MAKKHASSSASRLKAPVEHSARRCTTRGGGQAGAHQTRAQTDPQLEIVYGGQPRVVAQERVQEQVIRDTPSTMPIVSLPADAVIRLLNVLEALVPNNGGLSVPQTTSQTQTPVQLNVAATQTPQLTPQTVVHSVTSIGQSKDLKNFMDLKSPEFDAIPASIEPQKFIYRCEKILTTLGLKETHGAEFTNFLFSGSAEAW
ncbi:hypothetical protein HAX54_036400 [Datura stramonium]|uniref:Uncharacterized protein n=1 Tax=Datura stramonium TaxID=4076 RepID=A0ABS8VGU3_DATST|nr:hypothetical protein [Datura stramonium]